MTTDSRSGTIIHQLALRGLLDLADAVCVRRGVTRDELCGCGRSRAVAAARHEFWWLIRHHPERHYSFCEIARIVGRDHATVVHGVAAHQRLWAPQVTP
jgi:chromosomal replication initiation ATPase DnaA